MHTEGGGVSKVGAEYVEGKSEVLTEIGFRSRLLSFPSLSLALSPSLSLYSTDGKIWRTHLLDGPATVDQLWVNEERQHVARSPMLIYKSVTNVTVTFSDGSKLPGVNEDLSQARVVMYESWTMSYHTLRGIDRGTFTLLLGNPYDVKVRDG